MYPSFLFPRSPYFQSSYGYNYNNYVNPNSTSNIDIHQIILSAQMKTEQEKNEQMIEKIQKILKFTNTDEQNLSKCNDENKEEISTSTCDTQSLLILQRQSEIIKQQKEQIKKLQQQINEIKNKSDNNNLLPSTSSKMINKNKKRYQRSPSPTLRRRTNN